MPRSGHISATGLDAVAPVIDTTKPDNVNPVVEAHATEKLGHPLGRGSNYYVIGDKEEKLHAACATVFWLGCPGPPLTALFPD